MQEMFAILQACALFDGIDPADLPKLLACLRLGQKTYDRHAFVLHAGDVSHAVGIVLTGRVQILQEDFWGNRTLLSLVSPGEVFGEAFSFAAQPLPVSAMAAERSEVLLLHADRIAQPCAQTCAFHQRLVHNMLRILAEKNMHLTQTIEHMSRRTTREKLLSYLSAQARAAHSRSFTIPLNRQELANALAVDRSALSAELSRMQQDGLLRYHLRVFELLDQHGAPLSDDS